MNINRYLRYATNANGNENNLDYGEVVKIISDKLINLDMGGTGYILEAVKCDSTYVPSIGDWATVEWRNGQPIAKGGSGIATGLRNINDDVKVVSTNDLASGVINSNHIKTNTIEARHIQAYSIKANHIDANQVNANHIESNSIQARHISANSIISDHISANSIQTYHLNAGSITTDKIEANAITSNLISANTINGAHIVSHTIQSQHISANSILSEHISANSIQSQHISANSINATHLQASIITTEYISANSITGWLISANSIETKHIKSDSITSELISANSIKAEHIVVNSIQSEHISSNSIHAVHISANNIQSDHISANSILGKHIQSNSVDTDHLTVGARKEGLLGQYFTYDLSVGTSKFQVYKGFQIDPNIDFNWSTGSPSIVGQSDSFSVRWQGFVFAPEAGIYNFIAVADDTVKVVIDNKTIIEQTTNIGGEIRGQVQLEKDRWYPILVEMTEVNNNASIQLKWERPSLITEVVPSKYLTQGNTVIDGSTITTGSITANNIKTGTITAESGIIADLAIQTAHIDKGAITSAKIGNAEIQSIHIASGNVENIHIKKATIDHTKINSVDATTISVGQLIGEQIAAGEITGTHISGSSITGDHISANSIDSIHIKAGAITASEISAGSITTSKLSVGSVTGDVIRAGSISAHHISTVGLDAQQITVYNGATGETLIGSGFLRVDGLDVGVVRSDNLLANGLFMTASSAFGFIRDNKIGEAIAGTRSEGVGGHKIWKIDLSTGLKVAEIDVAGKKPYDISIHPSGNHAYVTVQGDNTLMQVDLANDLVGMSLNMPHGPARIKWTGDYLEDHKHFFILNTDEHDHNIPDSLTVVDSPPNSVNSDLYLHHNISLGNNPVDLLVDTSKHAYITMGKQGDIVVLDMTGHDSSLWKVKGRIPITAFATDMYHGGLDGTFGLNEVTGGDASSQYNKGTSGHTHTMHSHGGYGTPDGTMKEYEARGIAQSTDFDTLYVVDRKNGELVVIDKKGGAPYNALTGVTSSGTVTGDMGHDMGSMSTTTTTDGSALSPADLRNAGEVHGGGPATYYVRYRIPVGDSPEFVEVVNGKVYVTIKGSNELAIIDEQQILNEIQADRDYYGEFLGEGMYENWTVFDPMREINPFTVNSIMIGSSPTFMKTVGNKLYVTLSGQNQVVSVDTLTDSIELSYNTGSNPRGFAITPDGRYMYVANHGGVGELSFIYSSGPYIGDAFFGLEGGITYQGAEYWTPDRSDWTYDISGNIKSYSTVEFRVNEPFLNEGGYAKLTAYGTDYQYSLIEQDIYNVTNYSNGNNVVNYVGQRLVANSGNTIFYPSHEEWESTPAPSNIKIVEILSGNRTEIIPEQSLYTIYYGESSRVEFVSGTVGVNQWVEADYTSRYNQYFQPHNGSVLIAIENGSSPNFNTVFEIEEFIPKFVVWDNLQTDNFTPIEDGVNQEYTGLEYSLETNRAVGMTVTTSATPISGNTSLVVDGMEIDSQHGDTTMDILPMTSGSLELPSGNQYVEVDLGKKYMIGKVTVSHMYGADRIYHGTKTEVSEDGLNWSSIYDSAISGEYNEKPTYHLAHDHTHYAKVISFPAKPIRYIRDWSNGWTSGDGLTSGNENHWSEIKAYGDWEFVEDKVFPDNSENAGQQVATNGKGFVATDISKAFVAFDVEIEFTSWWYMTYIVGPEYGEIAIDMPTLMGGSHFLPQNGMYINNIAHRHIMSFPPSSNIKEDLSNDIKAGKHRVVIRQESGRVTLDRIRLEDYQFYQKNSTLIPSLSSSTTFQRKKLVAKEAQWYEGLGRQSTEGAYDKVRVSPDTGLPDKSVPIKYRVRVMSELNANGTTEERGIAYVTSAIFETGKQHTHWRPSASSDSYPGSKIEKWDSNQPHKTGIQTHHLAHGSVQGPKIMTGAVMDYHISNYARISEHKLDLNHPTHRHGRTVFMPMSTPMGMMEMPVFISNKDFLDSIEGYAGVSGNYGTGNTVARGDHLHDLATSGNAGFISASDFSKLQTVEEGANNYSHPIGAGNQHIPSGGVSGNFIKWISDGTGSWSNINWNDVNNKPTAFPPTQHTHTISEITDIGNSYYTKGEVDSLVANAGDVSVSGNNIFHETNTFDKAGLGVKIQPSGGVTSNTKLFQINNALSSELFSVNYSGGVTINGDLTVSGVQTYAGTTTVDGDYTINGALIVGGNSTLGDTTTDKTIVNGTLEVNGSIVEKGKLEEVMRFPVYGIAGDPEFQLEDQITFEDVVGHLYTFDQNNSALPPIPSGATRKFKIMVAYSTVGATSPATLRVVQNGTVTEITNMTLPTVNFTGIRGGTRTFLSPEFTTSFTGHTTFQAKCNNAGTSLIIRYIEIIAYDYYA